MTDSSSSSRAQALVDSVLARPPHERSTYLDTACSEDPNLRQEVQNMLILRGKPFSPAPGTRIRHYEILRPLGAGGMGEVFLAHDARLGRQVALKLLSAQSVCSEATRRRFAQEARTVATLNHPNIVTIFDVDLEGGPDIPDFIVMEYVEGKSLADAMSQQRLPLSQVLRLADQVASALQAAHEKGIVHRDLKPANIMLTARGEAKVLDFGLAKFTEGASSPSSPSSGPETQLLTTVGTVLGTVPYMSPEQALGRPVDARSDLFSFGSVLFEMVTGQRPFLGVTGPETVDHILHQDPGGLASFNAEAPSELDRVVAKCLEKDRDRRYASAEDLARDLQNLIRLRQDADTVRLAVPAGLVENLQQQGAKPSTSPVLPSIAILPFENLSGDPKDEYLSDSLTEELINGLGRIEGVRVAGRASVFACKGKLPDPEAIGKALKVQTLLQGGIHKNQDQLRISARLTRVADGAELWSQTWERSTNELFAVQEDLAQAVVSALKLKRPDKPGSRIVEPGTENLAAYDFYLRGRHRVWVQNEAVNRQALSDLQQAVALDPGFARAHAEIPQACWARTYFIEPDDHAALKLGFASAERALMLNPTLAEAHLARGQLAFTPASRFAYALAIKEFKKALALNRTLGAAWAQLSAVYTHVGLFEEATKAAHKAVELDPGDFTGNLQVATIPIWEGKYEDGLDATEQLPREINPTIWYWHTIWALRALERTHEAEARIDEFLKNHHDKGGLITSMRAVMHAAVGRHEEAEQAIQVAAAVDRRFGHFHHTAYEIAAAYALMNRRPEALKYLHEAVHTGFPCCPVIERDPNLKNLKSDPAFQEIMEWPRQQCEHFRTL